MHNIHTAVYKENVNKKSVQKEWDEYAAHEDWQEGCSGLGKDIRWLDGTIYEDEDAAEKAIERLDRGWYDQLAVKFYRPVSGKKTQKKTELEKKVKETCDDYTSKNSVIWAAGVKAEYVGCRNCGSKMKRDLIRSNCCPVCHGDLRPDTTIKAISAAKARWDKAQKDLKSYVKEYSAKEVMWLVKIEYHT